MVAKIFDNARYKILQSTSHLISAKTIRTICLETGIVEQNPVNYRVSVPDESLVEYSDERWDLSKQYPYLNLEGCRRVYNEWARRNNERIV